MAKSYEAVILRRDEALLAEAMASGVRPDAFPKLAGLDAAGVVAAKLSEYAVQEWLKGQGVSIAHTPLRVGYAPDPEDDFLADMAGKRVRVNVAHNERPCSYANPLMGVRCTADIEGALTIFTWRDPTVGYQTGTPKGCSVIWLVGWAQPTRIKRVGHFIEEGAVTYDTEHRVLHTQGPAQWQMEVGYLREISDLSRIIRGERPENNEREDQPFDASPAPFPALFDYVL